MSKRIYTPEEKKLVRRLLLIHEGNVAIVHHLTGFPLRTIRHWRNQWDDDYDLFAKAFAENKSSAAMANDAARHYANPAVASDSAFAEPADPFAEYAQLRRKLMEHTSTLTDGLLRGDGMVHQRVQAISRLLDRVLTLDEILPAQLPERTPENLPPNRIEFVYDGAIHDVPPWHGTDTKEGALRFNEMYYRGLKEAEDKRIEASFAAVDDSDADEHGSVNPESFSLF